MSKALTSKLDNRLQQHLQGIDLDALSRIDSARLNQKAIPNIGVIELVTGQQFAESYDDLYVSMFPKRAERERSDLIVERLVREFANQRAGLARYRVVGVRDPSGVAIGAAQFSVLPLPDGDFAVPYLQYLYVRPENRRQDLSDVLHAVVLAVASADVASEGRTVPFTLFETDPPGHGHDDASRAYAHERANIHMRGGAVALVLRRQSDRGVLSAHVQPGLEVDDPPVSLVWVIRPSPAPGRPYDVDKIGDGLIAAFYQSLRDEGFPEANIQLAETIVKQRRQNTVFEVLPLNEIIPDKN